MESMSAEEVVIPTITVRSEFHSRDTVRSYVYENDFRDPFHFIAPHRSDSLKKAIAKKPPWSPPPFKLTGILTAGKKHTAMIEGSNGAVFFLHEKDTLSGLKILRIDGQAVTYFYQKKKNDWILERP
jgi:hypothetical protein